SRFSRPATVITLQQNYRSTQTVLDAANAVIALAPERFTKDLFSLRPSDDRPSLVSVEDEGAQVQYVVERVLEHRESGSLLRQQAVLFRAAHHSDLLELELARRGIPFVKYGGLRFMEAAHVKDLICILRWAENPRDSIAGFRVLQLLPGVGPALAHRMLENSDGARLDFEWLPSAPVPARCRGDWSELCALMAKLRRFPPPWQPQLALVRRWYEPHLERLYDHPRLRAGDLDQLEQLASQHPTREQFLSELILDPPEASGAEAGPPVLDEDYLVLSTIHSAKGQEWDVVYLLNVVDGCIPSDMAAGSAEQIEEERRLLYVAMTRAKSSLYLLQPLRMFIRQQPRHGDRYLFAPRSRFIPDSILQCFQRRSLACPSAAEAPLGTPERVIDLPARVLSQWS
ncbi:MAG TPA: ATP-dependent helicase, partial [Myxococcaceae bacterium]|nr:ATP-dependent helicase [Myxococcaceae bacterium]